MSLIFCGAFFKKPIMDPNTQEDYFWCSYRKLTATEKAIFRKLTMTFRDYTPCSKVQNLYIEFMQLPIEVRKKVIRHFANLPTMSLQGVDWNVVAVTLDSVAVARVCHTFLHEDSIVNVVCFRVYTKIPPHSQVFLHSHEAIEVAIL